MDTDLIEATSLINSVKKVADSNKSELIDKINQLKDDYTKLSPFKTKYDYCDVPFNGIRSFLKIIEQFFAKIVEELTRSNKPKTLTLLSDVASILLTIAELQLDIVNGYKLSNYEVSQKVLSVSEQQYMSLFKLGHFWLPKDIQQSILMMEVIMVIGFKKWASLFSSHSRRKLLAWSYREVNVVEYKQVASMFRSRLLNFIVRRSFSCDHCQPEVEFKIKSKFQINEDGSISEQNVDKVIKIQILRTGSDERFNGKVIFHSFGGGWLAGDPITSQVFIRPLAQALPGVTIITPWYRLAPEHKFPAALQDVVDAYLAISGQTDVNVSDILGFEPKDIVVTGESSGANLTLSLSKVVAHIDLIVPKKMLLFLLPPSVRVSHIHPSTAMFVADLMLSPSMLHLIMDAYTPGGITDYDQNRTAWYRRSDVDEVTKRIDEIESFSSRQPFMNPTVGDLSCFNDTEVIIIGAEFDPVLDASIEVARKWPQNRVELVILENITHSALKSEGTKIATEIWHEKFRSLLCME